MFQQFGFYGASPLGSKSTTPKILRLVMVRHCIKCSSSRYNGWSVEIAGIKIFGRWEPRPLRVTYG